MCKDIRNRRVYGSVTRAGAGQYKGFFGQRQKILYL